MRKRHAVSIAIAAVLGALAVAALPALAGAKDDHGHHRGDHRDGGRQHGSHNGRFDRDEDTGTISAFDASSGKLTIALFGGESVTGLVTRRTDVRCGFGEDSARFSRESGNSGPGSGGDSGRGEAEPGDDNGGRGFEPGDDRGDHGNGRPCSAAELTVGAVVHEADLDLEHGIARFDEIELDHSS